MAEAQVSVAVLGAAGTIAPAIVHDLARSDEVARLTLLDLDPDKAGAVAERHGAGKASASGIDARDVDALARAIRDAGADVLLNTASYRINLEAMRACLKDSCHYLDLGGLYRMTLRQLELSAEFERAGRLAVLGIGSSPGKTNLMAAEAVRRLGRGAGGIQSIDVFAAGRDPAAPNDGRLRPPYAIQTLIDELTLEPVVLRDGRPEQIAPLSGGGTVDYGDPIGAAETIYTLHSELATFGESFGCRRASFRLSLAPALLARLRELAEAPAEEVAAAAREAASPSNQTVSVHLVKVAGTDGGTLTARAITRPHFGLGGSVISTATPAAACVRLFARGALTATGVQPPERCIEPAAMFAELEARGCTFSFAS
ncbi:MAG TPA: saccharopine dehydrogenase NADP-binding domain-containing protein [Solirubrobacteraceae bacterium]|nr:saccharopine dehydrogenase NADP-binding domain-containing protein [Solirubrobacteraceae bacterium]